MIDLHCSSNPLYCHLLHRWEKVLLIRTGLSPSPIHHHLTYCCSPCSCCCSPPHTHKHTVAQQFTLIESGLISYEVIIGCKQGCMSRELTFSRHQRKRGVEAGCVCVHVLASGHCTAPLSDQSSDWGLFAYKSSLTALLTCPSRWEGLFHSMAWG